MGHRKNRIDKNTNDKAEAKIQENFGLAHDYILSLKENMVYSFGIDHIFVQLFCGVELNSLELLRFKVVLLEYHHFPCGREVASFDIVEVNTAGHFLAKFILAVPKGSFFFGEISACCFWADV